MECNFQKPAHEDSKLEPWTVLAKHKLEVEKRLRNLEGLNYLIIRPAIVYGSGDKTGLGEISHCQAGDCVLLGG
jgi:nucleoside-diphosphate-sugar epimerase